MAHPLMVSTHVTIAHMLSRLCAHKGDSREIRALAEVLNSQENHTMIFAHVRRSLTEDACGALVAYLEHDTSNEVRIVCERLGLVAL